jgi:hypothetical protein
LVLYKRIKVHRPEPPQVAVRNLTLVLLAFTILVVCGEGIPVDPSPASASEVAGGTVENDTSSDGT